MKTRVWKPLGILIELVRRQYIRNIFFKRIMEESKILMRVNNGLNL